MARVSCPSWAIQEWRSMCGWTGKGNSTRTISYRWRHARRVGCGDDDLRHGERLDGIREIDTTHRRQARPETWRQRCIRAGDHPAADTRASDGRLRSLGRAARAADGRARRKADRSRSTESRANHRTNAAKKEKGR